MNISYLKKLKISLNQAVFVCCSNPITCQLIVLESCSNPEKAWKSESAVKNKIFGFDRVSSIAGSKVMAKKRNW